MKEKQIRKVWSYLPVDYRTWPSKVVPQVQKLSLKIGIHLSAWRLLFTNENGVAPLLLTDLRFCLLRQGRLVSRSPITFSGNNELYLGVDDRRHSDICEAELWPGDTLEIQVLLPQTTYLTSGVVTYSKLNYEIEHRTFYGNLIDPQQQFIMVRNNHRMNYFFGLYGLEAVCDQVNVVTVFGDSIVQQGFFANHLRQMLQADGQFAVNNAGIGGNRILFDTDPAMDNWLRHGTAGLKRFEHDVFGDGDPDLVFVFHGINDVIQETIHSGDVEVLDDVRAGLVKYAQIIKEHGVKSVIGTLMPLRHSIFYSEHVEQQRQRLNDWIRHQTYFDAVVDFDQAMQDTTDPIALRQDYDSGDGLHPSDEGGAAMARAAAPVVKRLFD
ncbi:GDSL-type esterase/lipase family protein [Lacticaseibacillus jixiensis]|uniref:GDSL-type esterase/lipase family protein n=1 Tax=Lacticaseibacillus jixiensis TaxID=3231926 RepID=UPI0036F425A3